MLSDTSWQGPMRDQYFYVTFLKGVGERKDHAERGLVRDRLLESVASLAAKTGDEERMSAGEAVRA